MARIIGICLGLIMMVGGVLLTAQANGWMDGPYDQGVWVTLGPLCAGFGVALVWVCARPRH